MGPPIVTFIHFVTHLVFFIIIYTHAIKINKIKLDITMLLTQNYYELNRFTHIPNTNSQH